MERSFLSFMIMAVIAAGLAFAAALWVVLGESQAQPVSETLFVYGP